MPRMSPSEALVETLRTEGVTVCPGIVGSAFMDALDLFPAAGIRFVPVRHEQSAAHMADAYARVTGRPSICIGQNGPGVTNMVTSMAAAYHAHSPVVLLAPAAGSGSKYLDGFQEIDQMAIFRAVTKFQVEINRPDRMAELLRLALRHAMGLRGPVHVDIPRDYLYGEADFEILEPERYRTDRRGPGDDAALDRAAQLIAGARHPVIVSGMGVIEADAIADVEAIAERIGAPVATSYLHNDAFPCDHELAVGPLGYQGSKAAMRMLRDADVIVALGTRLSHFGTLPQYGLDYFPADAAIVQVDVDYQQIGRRWPVAAGIIGDAGAAARAILARLEARGDAPDTATRRERVRAAKQEWAEEQRERWASDASPIRPQRALHELAKALTPETIVTTDIGNICSAANAHLRFRRPRTFLAALTFGNCGFAYPAALGAKLARPEAPVVAVVGDGAWGMSLHETMTAVEEGLDAIAVVFNNRQWGAEKRNQIDFYGNRFVGSNIGHARGGFDFAGIARAMGADGVRIEHPADLADAFGGAIAGSGPRVIEVMVDPEELAEPFRRDALKLPVRHLERYAHLTLEPQPAMA